MSIFGPTLRDLADLWERQDRVYEIRGGGPVRTTVGGVPVEPSEPVEPVKPSDDPSSPAPSPLAGAWQCPGCGTIYSMFVNSCGCQQYRWVKSDNKISLGNG
jgi:hypothetical protein